MDPNNQQFTPISNLNYHEPLGPWLKEKDLIILGTNYWNIEFQNTLFEFNTINDILKIRPNISYKKKSTQT